MVRPESFDRIANYILSKPQRNEMNRQYCDGRLSGMNALTAQRFISVQSMNHDEMGVRSDSLTFKFIYA